MRNKAKPIKPESTPAVEDPEQEKKDLQTKDWVPYGVYTFADLEIYKEAQETAGVLYETTDEMQQLIWNIMNSDEVDDKAKAVVSLAAEFESLVKARQKKKGLLERIKERIAPEKKEAPEPRFMVFKDDSGEYRWVSAYSNNFRDEDSPPEIISAKSHRGFVERVDKGEAPYPELWLWHQKEWKVGEATWVGVDEVGDGIVVALAAGHFDTDKQWVGEALARSGLSGVSHGMPVETILREDKDKSIITSHETREISALPPIRAANKLAGFTTLLKEADMTISDQKRFELAQQMGLTTESLDQIEESNKARAEKGVAGALETKDNGPQEEVKVPDAPVTVTTVVEVPETPASTETAETPQEEEATALEEVKESLLILAKEVGGVKDGVGQAIKALADRLDKVEASDKKRVEKELEETPSAAFNDIIKSVIGNSKTAVAAEDPLTKQKPKETEAPDEEGLPSFVKSLWKPA